MATLNTVFLNIGVDLGQRRDPTAVAVCELVDTSPVYAEPIWRYEARHIERLELGTPYPKVADRIAAIHEGAVRAVQQREFSRYNRSPDIYVRLYLDATGAVPALDMFRERGLAPLPCFFTHGDRRTETTDQVSIGKAWPVNRLQALAQNDRIHLPPHHQEASVMMGELMDYEIRIDQNANDRYGAFKTGKHDDLVTALGLAVQWSPPLNYGWARDVMDAMIEEQYG